MRNLWVGVLVLGVVVGGTLLLRFGPRACAFALGERQEAKEDSHVRDQGSEETQTEGEAPARVSRSAEGGTVVRLDAETQERVGLGLAKFAAATRHPEVVAYGILMEDPAESFTLRAPLPGILQISENGAWPSIGTVLPADTTVGWMEPRLTPVEQFDMTARLTAARAEVSSATAALEAARVSYESKKNLHDRDKAISDRAVEEAKSRVTAEEARLQAATETVRLLEACVETHSGTLRPLIVPRGGEVVEVQAQPGEAIESGQVVLRVVHFDKLLARVEVPAGERIDQSISSARFVVLGQEHWVMPGEPIGLAPLAGPQTQGQAYLFRVTTNGRPVRPGAAVKAYLALPGDPLVGVVVPRSAVIRTAGLTWVYVQTTADRFARRQVTLASPTETGWFTSSGLSAGDTVVTTGAQVLLSEELKAQIDQEAEEEE